MISGLNTARAASPPSPTRSPDVTAKSCPSAPSSRPRSSSTTSSSGRLTPPPSSVPSGTPSPGVSTTQCGRSRMASSGTSARSSCPLRHPCCRPSCTWPIPSAMRATRGRCNIAEPTSTSSAIATSSVNTCARVRRASATRSTPCNPPVFSSRSRCHHMSGWISSWILWRHCPRFMARVSS